MSDDCINEAAKALVMWSLGRRPRIWIGRNKRCKRAITLRRNKIRLKVKRALSVRIYFVPMNPGTLSQAIVERCGRLGAQRLSRSAASGPSAP
jgi:hypothetical protein